MGGMSGVFNVRWPDTDLESRLKALAVANRRSLQAEVLVALERYVGLALPAVAPLVGAEGHGAQGDPATTENEADLSRGVGLGHAGLKQPSVPTSEPRFVVPASCPAPNTKKSFKPDFK